MTAQLKTLLLMTIAVLLIAPACAKQSPAWLQLKRNSLPFSQTNPVIGKASSATANSAWSQNIPAPGKQDPQAPEQFRVRFKTSKGDFVAEINRAWSPRGVDRFHQMVSIGYFEDVAIFRAVQNFMFQFGLHGNPDVNKDWAEARIEDDPPVGISNLPGTLCFAKTGAPNSRSVQMFVNLGQNVPLDAQGFTPFGKVVQGMDVVKAINTEYGENPDREDVQGKLKREGNDYVLRRFPRIDLIRSVEFVGPNG